MAMFGKELAAGRRRPGAPYVSGLSPKGRLLAAGRPRPVVFSTPLVAWRPVVGATEYEVQWSTHEVPMARISADLDRTVATSARAQALARAMVLPRPRAQRRAGRDAGDDLVGARSLMRVVRPTFRVTGG